MRLLYVACPTSLTLQSANAIQTHSTLRELRRLAPETVALVPRWFGEPSRFGEVGAWHLPRPALGKLSRLYNSTLWYYAERSLFAAMTATVALLLGLRGRWPDVVYVRDTIVAFWWATVFGPMLNLPVIYEAHDLESTNPSRAKEAWAQRFIRAIDEGALRESAKVASLTEDFRRLLAERGLRPPTDVAVIPDAFDEHAFYPGDRRAARDTLGIPPETPLIVYAGLSFSYRGLDRLVSAFPQVQAALPKVILAFVGGRPPEIEALRTQAASLHLDDAVRFLGPRPQSEVLRWLQAADVLVIPDTVTDVTASPLKLFEYLATERAVVLPGIPALMEVLPDTVGYYFTRGDPAALGRVLVEALRDPDRPSRECRGREAVEPHTYAARATRILGVAHPLTC